MGIVASALFASLAITVGVLTVYFTSPRPRMSMFELDFGFKTHLLSI
jgi:hypothetical protein